MAKKAAKSKEEQAAVKEMQAKFAANPPVMLIRKSGGKAIMVRRSDVG